MKSKSNLKEKKSTAMSRLNRRILSGQKRLAEQLNYKCRRISSRGLLAMLIAFTALVSATLLMLIISAIL